MESPHFNTSPVPDKWHRWKSHPTSKGRYVSRVLLQSGRDERWWSDSMECYCYLRNVQDLLADGKTPHEWRFGEPLKGPIIPFGAMVEYHPSSPKDQSRIHQFGKKVLPRIFLDCELIAEEFGKEISWLATWKTWKWWMHRIFTLEESKQRKYW